MAPCGGAGCVAVLGREVTALLLAMWSTTATEVTVLLLATVAAAPCGSRRPGLLLLGARSSWCALTSRRLCGSGFSGACAFNAKVSIKDLQDFTSPPPYVTPRRHQFVCHHSSSSVVLGIRIWAPSSYVFPLACSMQGLLFELSSRSSDLMMNSVDILSLLSPGMLTPKSTAQQQTSICAVIVEATGWGFRFVKRCARRRRPKVAFVAALPQLPVDVHLLCCVVSI
ncbi:hypothetical protein [Oryza sativa Japonica Group]|uniref:Uncharacterized protein n=1 Tax=Oryza sativa subsp. japonica TaxID=39947 RepID=Q5JL60_ORYSJ|nr:hypothetical protein [Oryza sativa Japonica Group]BAD87797.1 hypothetical protein [Oryza sativa Japonica Group]